MIAKLIKKEENDLEKKKEEEEKKRKTKEEEAHKEKPGIVIELVSNWIDIESNRYQFEIKEMISIFCERKSGWLVVSAGRELFSYSILNIMELMILQHKSGIDDTPTQKAYHRLNIECYSTR